MQSNPSLSTGAISRVYAGVSGLSAFVIAIVAGLYAHNSAAHTLTTALFCMIACYLLGTLLGAISEHAVRAHLAAFRDKHPVPEAAPAIVADQARAA